MKTKQQEIKNLGRLKGRSDFLRVQNSGKKWISKNFILQMDEGLADIPRFGVTVTKRLEKSAVKRNRIKRRLRAAAYDVMAGEPTLMSGSFERTDFVLLARQGLIEAEYTDIKKDLRWCLGKLAAQQSETEKAE